MKKQWWKKLAIIRQSMIEDYVERIAEDAQIKADLFLATRTQKNLHDAQLDEIRAAIVGAAMAAGSSPPLPLKYARELTYRQLQKASDLTRPARLRPSAWEGQTDATGEPLVGGIEL